MCSFLPIPFSFYIFFLLVSIFSRGEMLKKLIAHRLNSFDGDTSHTSFNKTIPATFAIFSLKVHINTTTTTSSVAYSSWNLEKFTRRTARILETVSTQIFTYCIQQILCLTSYPEPKGLLHKTNKNTTLKEMSYLPLNIRNSRDMRSQFSYVKRKKTSSDAFSYSRLALIAAIVLAVLPNSANSFSTQHKHIIMPSVANNINSCRANSIISDRRSTICNMSMPTPSSMVRDFIWMNKEV